MDALEMQLALGRAPGLTAQQLRIAADRRWAETEQISLIDAASPRYPPLLAQAAAAPALLYVKGHVCRLSSAQLAMVGSRNPTQPGARRPRAFAGYLSAAGRTITSGLAAGIDAASHEGALENGGATIAVLGT